MDNYFRQQLENLEVKLDHVSSNLLKGLESEELLNDKAYILTADSTIKHIKGIGKTIKDLDNNSVLDENLSDIEMIVDQVLSKYHSSGLVEVKEPRTDYGGISPILEHYSDTSIIIQYDNIMFDATNLDHWKTLDIQDGDSFHIYIHNPNDGSRRAEEAKNDIARVLGTITDDSNKYSNYLHKEPLEIKCKYGMHARPCAEIAKIARKEYKGDIGFKHTPIDGRPSEFGGAKSITSLLMLGASKGGSMEFYFEPGHGHTNQIYNKFKEILSNPDA